MALRPCEGVSTVLQCSVVITDCCNGKVTVVLRTKGDVCGSEKGALRAVTLHAVEFFYVRRRE